GAVVVPPRERRRRPAPGGIALVRVDRRREKDRELARARDPAGEEGPERLALAGERVVAVAPEARVDVAGVADPGVVRLRHERDRAAVRVRDLLGAVLVDDVIVGHAQRIGVPEVDLVLARPGLPLRALDGDPGALHAVANLADEALVV